MLIFNEGVPRAGKSYDAVVTHILPAIKKGRKVFARLNGLDHEKIAGYLGMDADDVRGLLVVLSEEDMPRVHKIVEPDSLVVIDECHKYYVQSLKALPADIETFFAEHGQAGMDILLISQWYKRLHAAIRARVERKTIFQKLTALGMQGSYLATYYHTTGPDKFEKVGKAKKKYDPAIFPLYHGYKPDATNTEVYEEGGITVWKTVLPWFIIAGVLALVGGFYYVRYFTGSGSKPKPAPVAAAKAPSLSPPSAVAARPVTAVPPVRPPAEAKPKHSEMPPEVAYVWSLSDQGRARLAAEMIYPDGRYDGVIQWLGTDQNRVIDSLTVTQLRALGVTVAHRPYGIRLTWGKGKELQTIIVTAWPIDPGQRYSQETVRQIRESGPVVASMLPSSGGWGAADASTTPPSKPRATATTYVPPEYGEWNPDALGGR